MSDHLSQGGQVGLAWRGMPIAILAAIALERAMRETSIAGASASWKRILRLRNLEIVLALGMYFISGPALILLNKHIMTKLAFRFPIAISTLGNCGMTLVAHTAVLSGVCKLRSPVIQKIALFRLLLPLSAFSSASLVLGNCAYLYISVPLIQILKSGTIVLVMGIGFLMRVERFSWQLVSAVAIIALGIAISVGYDADTSQRQVHGSGTSTLLLGVALMLMANTAEAGKAIFTQVSVERFSVLDSLYWVSPVVAVMGLALTYAFEWTDIAATPLSPRLLYALAGSCMLGACVNLSTMWATKLVGGLSMKVLVGARNIGLVLFAAAALDEPCSSMQYVGYSAALLGMALYDRARQSEVLAASGSDDNAKNPQEGSCLDMDDSAKAANVELLVDGSQFSYAEPQCVQRKL